MMQIIEKLEYIIFIGNSKVLGDCVTHNRKVMSVMCHFIFYIFHLIGDNFVLLEALEETSGRLLLRRQSG